MNIKKEIHEVHLVNIQSALQRLETNIRMSIQAFIDETTLSPKIKIKTKKTQGKCVIIEGFEIRVSANIESVAKSIDPQ